jgi:GMP synthase (glutamine-hydrolysing)
MCEETIAVVDFGGQYAHLVARRVRALGVHSRIVQPEGFDPAGLGEVVGVILSGGPGSVTSAGHATVSFDPRRCGVPVLGPLRTPSHPSPGL